MYQKRLQRLCLDANYLSVVSRKFKKFSSANFFHFDQFHAVPPLDFNGFLFFVLFCPRLLDPKYLVVLSPGLISLNSIKLLILSHFLNLLDMSFSLFHYSPPPRRGKMMFFYMKFYIKLSPYFLIAQ